MVLVVKNPPADAGDIRDAGSNPGLGRSPGEGNGNPLQYFCMENPTNGGAWWATVDWVSKSRTQLSNEHTRCFTLFSGLPWWLSGKEFSCQCRRHRLDLWVRKIPWWRKRQLTPAFLSGKSHGQRSLMGYSPWDHRRVRHDLVNQQQQQI